MNPIHLGVNIDHIATIRQARATRYPDPVAAAILAEQAGASGITVHLREDRRHIQDRDIYRLKEAIQTRMNFEMAVLDEMIKIALDIRPEFVCLVPEKREEVTTEGGLDVITHFECIRKAIDQFSSADINVSLFIDADRDQIDAAVKSGAGYIEIHTGAYAEATDTTEQHLYLEKIRDAAAYAVSQGLMCNAGHGLHYHNVQAIARIEHFHELNIGHAIVARASMTGMSEAVSTMCDIMWRARLGLETRG